MISATEVPRIALPPAVWHCFTGQEPQLVKVKFAAFRVLMTNALTCKHVQLATFMGTSIRR